jgi:LmbE family N-acetylglucosaminyl deacetylase/ActR/RegA family two-component response regulator
MDPFRVLVVEDDPDVALYSKTVLERRGDCIVMTLADARQAAAAIVDFEPEVLVTDIELPGMSGLELTTQVREMRPHLPVIVMTAHASIDYAVTALRNNADEFLTKPVSAAALLGHVTRLGAASRLAISQADKPEIVLAIGAHPDDVETGVGGILAAHRAAGDDVTILTLSRGMRDGGIQGAWNESSRSASVIGATLVLEDALTSQSGQSVLEIIRRTIEELSPTVLYVHSKNDDNQDHRTVHDAALVAAAKVPTVACYQGTGATVDFRPNRFISIDGHTDTKLAMLECFAPGDVRPAYLEPDFALATARAWSRYGSGRYTEALEIVRDTVSV